MLSQTYKDLQIIVVDDNKDYKIREEVKAIIKSYSDSRLELICNSNNLGGALSRNVGIIASKGRFIAFLDDDDEYLPEKIEKQYLMFREYEASNLALVYCYCIEIGYKKNKYYHYDYIGDCYYAAMLDCIAATSQWMCRKEALMKVGLFSNVPCKQDSTVILKLLFNGYSVNRVPEYLSIYHSDGIVRISTQSHEKRIVGEEKLRELCRSEYWRINRRQIQEIEYSFCCRLIEHYYAIKNSEKFYECSKMLLKYPFRKRTMSAFYHVIKHRLFSKE